MVERNREVEKKRKKRRRQVFRTEIKLNMIR